ARRRSVQPLLAYRSFLSLRPRRPTSTLFPYTTLFRSVLSGKVQMESSGVQPVHGSAGRVTLNFSGKNLLTMARAEENVKLVQERSEEHTSELQSRGHLVCRLLLEKKKDCFQSFRLHRH